MIELLFREMIDNPLCVRIGLVAVRLGIQPEMAAVAASITCYEKPSGQKGFRQANRLG
jgi:hypothetical protein